MEISNFGAESSSHVAQQSRRDKLRIQSRLQDFSDNLDQQLQPSLVHNQVRNLIRSGNNGNNLVFQSTTIGNVFSTYEFVNFATNSNANNDDQELGGSSVQPHRLIVEAGQDSSFAMSHPILSNFTSSPKTSATNHDPQGCCGNWRSLEGSHQTSYDWMMNYGSMGGDGVVMSSDARVVINGSYQDVHVQSVGLATHLSEISGHDRHKLFRDMQFGSHHHSIYHNNLPDVASTSFGCNDQRSNLFPYGNQSAMAAAVQFDNNANAWMSRPVENSHQWSGELGFIEKKSDHELRPIASRHPNSQSLSLSLSSNPSSDVYAMQFGEGYESEYLHSKADGAALKEDTRAAKSSSYMCPIEKPTIISRSSGKSLQDIVGSSSCAFRSTGPLGPFTGYATILKSSRFMKAAQELLEELCNATCSKILRSKCEISERVSGDQASVSTLADVNPTDIENVGRQNHDSGMSSSSYSFNEGGIGDGRDGSGSSCEPYKPGYQQKKAKLLYMQEEVWRRYKQYHQQMQMVASSFESVAGLSAATPYVSLALKTVSRNFRCLRNAISDQLKHVTKALGEDLLLTNAIASSSRGDTSTSRFRYMDQSFQKQKYGGANAGFFEPQQQVYRPQRGLPERSVAILRAWLFDHFLHPYPTDTDKHMLATQTGLSRNQVSNWFINARVRVWKPMVEEIHMLETKGLVETNRNSTKNDVNSAEGTSQPTGSAEQMDEEQWNLERKSNEEFQVPTGMDGSLLNFLPYQRNTIDVGGLGAVSLTLGLRHGVENASQQHEQQQFQQHEDQLRRQFGGQMIHDFVG